MRNLLSCVSPKILSHAAIVAVLAGTGAACSNDATRLSQPVFTNSTGSRAASNAAQDMPPKVVGSNNTDVAAPVRSGAVAGNDLPPAATRPGYVPSAPARTASATPAL